MSDPGYFVDWPGSSPVGESPAELSWISQPQVAYSVQLPTFRGFGGGPPGEAIKPRFLGSAERVCRPMLANVGRAGVEGGAPPSLT